jgi:hypothetical protein
MVIADGYNLMSSRVATLKVFVYACCCALVLFHAATGFIDGECTPPRTALLAGT